MRSSQSDSFLQKCRQQWSSKVSDHLILTQLHISEHIQMHKNKYETTAFLASSRMTTLERIKCHINKHIEIKYLLLRQGKRIHHSGFLISLKCEILCMYIYIHFSHQSSCWCSWWKHLSETEVWQLWLTASNTGSNTTEPTDRVPRSPSQQN